MPRPNLSYLVQLRGNLANGSCRWTCSWAMSSRGPGSAQGYADAMVVRLGDNGLLDGLLNTMTPQDTIIELTAFQYGNTGTVIDQGRSSINQAGAVTPTHPKSTAAAVTLRTALPTRSGRGRIYFPATGIPIGENGLMVTANVQPLVDAMQDLVDEPFLEGSQLQVYSPTDGVSRDVTSVDADRIPDRQENREKGLVAGRVFPSS